MIGLLTHLFATGLAWIAGRSLLDLVRPGVLRGRGRIERGVLAYVAGLTLVSLELLLLGAVGLASPWALTVLQLPLVALGLARRRSAPPAGADTVSGSALAWWEWVLVVAIASKFAFLFVMNLSELFRTDDAYKVWLLFAKQTHFEGDHFAREMTRGYPKLPALMLAYFTTMRGPWDEFAANLPYLNYVLAIAGLFYTACRWRLSRGASLAATYALTAFPLLLTHAILVGLADLPMTLALLGSAAYLYRYTCTGERDELLLAVGFMLLLPWIKLEGRPFLLFCLLVLAAAVVHRRLGVSPAKLWAAVAVLGLAGVGVLALLANVYVDSPPPLVPAQIWDRVRPGNHWDEVAAPFFAHFVLGYNNWMVLGTVAGLAVLPLAALTARRSEFVLGMLALLLLASYVYIFVFGDAYLFAVRGTTLNRSYLQMLPILLYACAVMLQRRAEATCSPAP